MSHRLALTGLHVTRERQPDKRLQLGDFDEAGASLLSFLRSIVPKLSWESSDGKHQIVARAARVDAKAEYGVAALVQTGEKGIVSVITESDGTQVHQRTATQTESLSALIYAYCDPAATLAYLVTHTPHRRLVKSGVTRALKKAFKEAHPNHILQMEAMMPADDLSTLLERASVKAITLRAYDHINEFEDRAGVDFSETLGYADLVLKKRRRLPTLPKQAMNRVVNDAASRQALLGFGNLSFDEIIVDVDDRGERRRLVLDDNELPPTRASYDVTDAVGGPGEPPAERLVNEAIKLLELTGAVPEIRGERS